MIALPQSIIGASFKRWALGEKQAGNPYNVGAWMRAIGGAALPPEQIVELQEWQDAEFPNVWPEPAAIAHLYACLESELAEPEDDDESPQAVRRRTNGPDFDLQALMEYAEALWWVLEAVVDADDPATCEAVDTAIREVLGDPPPSVEE